LAEDVSVGWKKVTESQKVYGGEGEKICFRWPVGIGLGPCSINLGTRRKERSFRKAPKKMGRPRGFFTLTIRPEYKVEGTMTVAHRGLGSWGAYKKGGVGKGLRTTPLVRRLKETDPSFGGRKVAKWKVHRNRGGGL